MIIDQGEYPNGCPKGCSANCSVYDTVKDHKRRDTQ